MECLTCSSLSGKKPILSDSRVYEGKFWVVEHAYPVGVLGWMVVILKRHCESLHQLTKKEFSELAEIQEKTVKLLFNILKCNKEYLACFAESEKFQHIHLHLIAKPSNLGVDFKGPKIFELLENNYIERESVLSFCQKLKNQFNDS